MLIIKYEKGFFFFFENKTIIETDRIPPAILINPAVTPRVRPAKSDFNIAIVYADLLPAKNNIYIVTILDSPGFIPFGMGGNRFSKNDKAIANPKNIPINATFSADFCFSGKHP